MPATASTTLGSAVLVGKAERKSTWLLVLAAILFAVMALSAKRASARLGGPEVACLRFAIGLVVAVSLPVLSGRRLRPQRFGALFLRGLFGGVAVLMYFGAIEHLPVGIATLLNSSSPLFVALFSTLFLHEYLGLGTVLALAVTSAGVSMVVLGNSPGVGLSLLRSSLSLSGQGSSLSWALVGLGSAVLSGAAVTTVRAMRQTEGSWEIFAGFCLIGGLITLGPTAMHWVSPVAADWPWLVLMSLSSVSAQIMMTHALRDVPAVKAGLLLQLTPITTLTGGVMLLGEQLTLTSRIGAVVTLLGISWGVLERGRRAARNRAL